MTITGKVPIPLLSISLKIKKIPVELRILKERNIVYEANCSDLQFFLDLINLYLETFVCFNQVVHSFAGMKYRGVILASDL